LLGAGTGALPLRLTGTSWAGMGLPGQAQGRCPYVKTSNTEVWPYSFPSSLWSWESGPTSI
jgi:hypothetical protein